jgi:hypothetical protein
MLIIRKFKNLFLYLWNLLNIYKVPKKSRLFPLFHNGIPVFPPFSKWLRGAFLILIPLIFLNNPLLPQNTQNIPTDTLATNKIPPPLSGFNRMINGITSSFHNLNPKDTSKTSFLQDFSGNLGIQIPLKKSKTYIYNKFQTQGEPSNNLNLNATVRWNPLSYYYIYVTFYKYVQSKLQAPWHPDFAYSLGYEDWNPYTFSLIYSNYQGNRLLPDSDKDEVFTRFLEGTVSLGWKFPTPLILETLLCHHWSSNVMHQICMNITPKYYDLKTNEKLNSKISLSLETKYYVYDYFFLRLHCFYYPKDSQQQPWDPDFNYGFGYFDWHYGTFTVQYNNYTGNRYFWSDKPTDSGKFNDGFLSINWSWGL